MATAPENRLTALRKILDDRWRHWDPARDDPAEMAARLNGITAILYPSQSQRDSIVAFVAIRGTARATEIAAHIGLSVSSVGGHLRALDAQQRLQRTRRGRYALGPAALPPAASATAPPVAAQAAGPARCNRNAG